MYSCPYLHLNVQNAGPPQLLNVLDGGNTRAVAVAAKRGVLDETPVGDQLIKLWLADKVVLDTILLAAARAARRVRYAEAKAVGELVEEALKNGRLAGARGARYDYGAGGCGRHGCGGGEQAAGGWGVEG